MSTHRLHPYLPCNRVTIASCVAAISCGSSTANAGNPMIDNSPESSSLLLDSRGNMDCNTAWHLCASSAST